MWSHNLKIPDVVRLDQDHRAKYRSVLDIRDVTPFMLSDNVHGQETDKVPMVRPHFRTTGSQFGECDSDALGEEVFQTRFQPRWDRTQLATLADLANADS